eukprot:COSAG01_NODE_16700_length_1213_cov_1.309695_1_plen_282_part_01
MPEGHQRRSRRALSKRARSGFLGQTASKWRPSAVAHAKFEASGAEMNNEILRILDTPHEARRPAEVELLTSLLATVGIFSKIKPEGLRLLCANITGQVLQPGQVLFAEGDHGDTLYVVLEGEVEIWIGGPPAPVLKEVQEAAQRCLQEEQDRQALVREQIAQQAALASTPGRHSLSTAGLAASGDSHGGAPDADHDAGGGDIGEHAAEARDLVYPATAATTEEVPAGAAAAAAAARSPEAEVGTGSSERASQVRFVVPGESVGDDVLAPGPPPPPLPPPQLP